MRIDRASLCAFFAMTMIATALAAAPQQKNAQNVNPPVLATKAATAAAPAAQADASAGSAAANLPMRRVVLYKSGVGYFEHQGQVRGDQTVGIDFTSGQLNDVLQSLTILD